MPSICVIYILQYTLKSQRILGEVMRIIRSSVQNYEDTCKKKKSQTAFNYAIYNVRYYNDCFDENKKERRRKKKKR